MNNFTPKDFEKMAEQVKHLSVMGFDEQKLSEMLSFAGKILAKKTTKADEPPLIGAVHWCTNGNVIRLYPALLCSLCRDGVTYFHPEHFQSFDNNLCQRNPAPNAAAPTTVSEPTTLLMIGNGNETI